MKSLRFTVLILLFCCCSIPQKDSLPTELPNKENTNASNSNEKPGVPFFQESPIPGPTSDIMLNEKNEPVSCYPSSPKYFCKPSVDGLEFFRVYITSESYEVRQIRGSELIKRRPDPQADQLFMEEILKLDYINFQDDGIIMITFSPTTKKVDSIKFHSTVPRINEVAKILQNDASRWKWDWENNTFSHDASKFLIHYTVRLKNNLSREEVKELLKKKKTN
jgi:hypothetical protein